jgi:beta-phosphoglucomutase-like phosphatase (HAD superfamily)
MTRVTTYAANLLLSILSGSSAFQPAVTFHTSWGVSTMAIHSTNEATDVAAPAPPTTMTSISSISSPEILDKYDTFLLDMWGVMHDGSKPYEGVLQTVKELKGMGKNLIILSNSSKRRENSHKMLGKREFQLLVYL